MAIKEVAKEYGVTFSCSRGVGELPWQKSNKLSRDRVSGIQPSQKKLLPRRVSLKLAVIAFQSD